MMATVKKGQGCVIPGPSCLHIAAFIIGVGLLRQMVFFKSISHATGQAQAACQL